MWACKSFFQGFYSGSGFRDYAFGFSAGVSVGVRASFGTGNSQVL